MIVILYFGGILNLLYIVQGLPASICSMRLGHSFKWKLRISLFTMAFNFSVVGGITNYYCFTNFISFLSAFHVYIALLCINIYTFMPTMCYSNKDS